MFFFFWSYAFLFLLFLVPKNADYKMHVVDIFIVIYWSCKNKKGTLF
jgi:hypothetical protein